VCVGCKQQRRNEVFDGLVFELRVDVFDEGHDHFAGFLDHLLLLVFELRLNHLDDVLQPQRYVGPHLLEQRVEELQHHGLVFGF